jgi:hypothetical protein
MGERREKKMNKAFLAVMLVVFVMFGSHQAWAMGKRHSSGGFGSGGHPNGFSWNNGNLGGNDNPGVNNLSGPSGNDNKQCDFPAGVTVPEPATMLLMGAGAMAGGLLFRRKPA